MKAILPGIMLLVCLTGTAQTSAIKSPACKVHRAGNYFIELADCVNYIDIYLSNLKGNPVRGIALSGSVEFRYIDKTCARSELIQYKKTNSLRTEVPASGFYDLKITLFIKGDTISSYFCNGCNLRAQAKR